MSEANGLPKGWGWTTIESIANTSTGGTPSRRQLEFFNGDIPWVKSGELGDSVVIETEESITTAAIDNSSAKLFPKGTLCVALYGATVGKLGILGIDAATNQAICGIFLPSEVNTRFLYYFLLSIRRDLIQQGKGGAQSNISNSIVRKTRFPLPPLNEQRRIVAKIEELFSDLDAGVAALERAKANLKRYRAAVLKSAVEGRLTAHWRAENPNVEPASELLKRLLIERRHRWEQALLAKYQAQGKQPPKGWQDKYQEPKPPDTKNLPELPPNWCWATVEQLGEVVTGSTPSTSRKEYFGGGVPFVKPTDLNVGYHVRESADTLTEAGANVARRLPPRTPLVTCIGATIGKTGLGRVSCATNQQINAVVVDSDRSLPEWLYWVFVSPFGQEWIKSNASATTLPILNKGRFETFPVPLPPFDEMANAVLEVEQIDSVREQLEYQLQTNGRRAARLRQAILKRAFRGELVPQDPADEPAGELLARIQAERRRTENGKASKKRT